MIAAARAIRSISAGFLDKPEPFDETGLRHQAFRRYESGKDLVVRDAPVGRFEPDPGTAFTGQPTGEFGQEIPAQLAQGERGRFLPRLLHVAEIREKYCRSPVITRIPLSPVKPLR